MRSSVLQLCRSLPGGGDPGVAALLVACERDGSLPPLPSPPLLPSESLSPPPAAGLAGAGAGAGVELGVGVEVRAGAEAGVGAAAEAGAGAAPEAAGATAPPRPPRCYRCPGDSERRRGAGRPGDSEAAGIAESCRGGDSSGSLLLLRAVQAAYAAALGEKDEEIERLRAALTAAGQLQVH